MTDIQITQTQMNQQNSDPISNTNPPFNLKGNIIAINFKTKYNFITFEMRINMLHLVEYDLNKRETKSQIDIEFKSKEFKRSYTKGIYAIIDSITDVLTSTLINLMTGEYVKLIEREYDSSQLIITYFSCMIFNQNSILAISDRYVNQVKIQKDLSETSLTIPQDFKLPSSHSFQDENSRFYLNSPFNTTWIFKRCQTQRNRKCKEIKQFNMKADRIFKINKRYTLMLEEDARMINVFKEYQFHIRIIDTKKNIVVQKTNRLFQGQKLFGIFNLPKRTYSPHDMEGFLIVFRRNNGLFVMIYNINNRSTMQYILDVETHNLINVYQLNDQLLFEFKYQNKKNTYNLQQIEEFSCF
ncbi:UNKNOWN [Stylonychia lemnae]|uniref:Uncharacterized protein n=1 Tax=Stylonychia lemnae TaxID=5949 RepID=A0A077ZWL5_STYLE|nr:UNKNOWN [Stylonychia lemnae]|eukprot:CDW73976.1 UNKNOWN [Stylonychia lemnae]